MDVLRLTANRAVRIEINDAPLLELCVASVRHLGRRSIDAARSYTDVHLTSREVREHFYGRSDHVWAPLEDDEGDEDPILLGCHCGDDACSPVTARITVTQDTVTWSDFRSGLDWDSTLIGPFVFDRRQYDEAIDAARLPSLTKNGKLRTAGR